MFSALNFGANYIRMDKFYKTVLDATGQFDKYATQAWVQAQERLRGEDYWVPADPREICEIPFHQMLIHGPIEKEPPFWVRKCVYKGRPCPLYHVTLTWTEPIAGKTVPAENVVFIPGEDTQSSDEEEREQETVGDSENVRKRKVSAPVVESSGEIGPETSENGYLRSKSSGSRPETPDRPFRRSKKLAGGNNEEKEVSVAEQPAKSIEKELSIFRSNDYQEAEDSFQSCLRCRDLFLLLPSGKYLSKLLEKNQSHPLWESVHIAAHLGILVFFQQFKPNEEKIIKLLNTPSQPEGLYPLHIAVGRNHIELVKLMVNLGGNIGQTDVAGCNSLHHGARASSPMLEALFETKDAKLHINALNADGYTPLFLAVKLGNPLCANALLKQGAELNVRCKGRSPLFEAMQYSNGAKTKQLVKEIVEASNDILSDVDPSTGNTALHAALHKNPLGALLSEAYEKIDINKKNKAGQTALHTHTHRGDIGCVVTLASYNVDLNAQDSVGQTALHIACSAGNLDLIRAFLVLGADPNIPNRQGDTPRHLAARLPTENKKTILSSLSLCGAERCRKNKIGCSTGCADRQSLPLIPSESNSGYSSSVDIPSMVGETPIEKKPFDLEKFKQDKCMESTLKWAEEWQKAKEESEWGDKSWVERAPKVICLLGLDGGGIRGLVLLKVLMAVEKQLGEPVTDYFDFVAGTSTGSFVAAGLCLGKSLKECLRIYLRFKDQLFDGWVRPYDSLKLEEFIKRELGDDSVTMANFKKHNVVVTATKADIHPITLKLFRSYRLPGLSEEENLAQGYENPSKQRLWKSLRYSSAAPTYFTRADQCYVDGGLISNNPTLDLMTEVDNWNSALDHKGRPSNERLKIGCVLSIGTGRIPNIPLDSLDIGLTQNPYTQAMAMKNLGIMFVDQVTATDGAGVARARGWCHTLGAPYFRLSTPISKDIMMDTTDDRELVNLMWDATVYVYENHAEIKELCDLLKCLKSCKKAGIREASTEGDTVKFK